ncbi:hypothetical protein AKJ16_DCAP05774 [Drosera capensis]
MSWPGSANALKLEIYLDSSSARFDTTNSTCGDCLTHSLITSSTAPFSLNGLRFWAQRLQCASVINHQSITSWPFNMSLVFFSNMVKLNKWII